jgi:hypothetical protein
MLGNLILYNNNNTDTSTAQIFQLETRSNFTQLHSSVNWSEIQVYASPPPFSLIGSCERHVRSQKVDQLVLVAPVWPTQPWYPLLLQLCGSSTTISNVSSTSDGWRTVTPSRQSSISWVETADKSNKAVGSESILRGGGGGSIINLNCFALF